MEVKGIHIFHCWTNYILTDDQLERVVRWPYPAVDPGESEPSRINIAENDMKEHRLQINTTTNNVLTSGTTTLDLRKKISSTK